MTFVPPEQHMQKKNSAIIKGSKTLNLKDRHYAEPGSVPLQKVLESGQSHLLSPRGDNPELVTIKLIKNRAARESEGSQINLDTA